MNHLTGFVLWLLISLTWDSDHNAAYSIAMCESRGVYAENGAAFTRDGKHKGLLQVNEDLWGTVSADPVEQLRQGYKVYKAQGLDAWRGCI